MYPGVIGLPVELQNIPNEIVIQDSILLKKTFFHISLVCISEIVKKYKVSVSDFENKIINDFCDFTKTNNISLLNYLEEFKFVIKDDLKAVVVLCKVSNLDKFFELINKKYELDIEYPPTHVTLYTPEGKPGIFLTDVNDIKNLTKPIPNPVGRLL